MNFLHLQQEQCSTLTVEWSFRICKTNAIEAVAKIFYFATASILAGRKIVQIGQTEPVGVCPEASPHQVSLAIFLFYRNSWLVPLLRLSQKMVIDHFLKKEKLRSVTDSRTRESA